MAEPSEGEVIPANLQGSRRPVSRESKEAETSVRNCYILVHPLFDFEGEMSGPTRQFYEKVEARFLELIDSLKDKPSDVLVIVLFKDAPSGIRKLVRDEAKMIELADKAKEVLGRRAVVTTCLPESLNPVDDNGDGYGRVFERLKDRGYAFDSSSRIIIGGESSRECVKNLAINIAARAETDRSVILDLALTEDAGMDTADDPIVLEEMIMKQRPDVGGKLVVRSDWKSGQRG